MTDERLIVALDLPSPAEAEDMARRIGDQAEFYKIGLQLLPIGGMQLARTLRHAGKSVFLDFKLLDISATVEKATRSIAGEDAQMLTVHAEPAAMKAAVRGRGDADLKLLAVTVLTSYDDAALEEIGYRFKAQELVKRRAGQALEAGMDGVVASPLEAAMLRAEFGADFLIVTPGVRPAGAAMDDQKRAAGPAEALANGASHLVVGRPITASDDPAEAARAIVGQMAAG